MLSFSSLEPGGTEGVSATCHSSPFITHASVANVWIVIHLASPTKHSSASRKSVVALASVASIDGEGFEDDPIIICRTTSFSREAQRQQNSQQRQKLHLCLLCEFQP